MPTRIHHLISEEETFEYRLQHRLEHCQEAILASAFFTWAAFQALKNPLTTALEAGSKIAFLVGRFDLVTEPRAVESLIKLRQKHKDNLVVRFDGDHGFHYKLATFKAKGTRVVIIGSSNLTGKGLGSKGEANLEIVGYESVYRDAVSLLQERIDLAPDAEEEIDEYRKAYNRAKKYRRQRNSLMKSGNARWRRRKKSVPKTDQLTGSRYPFCWIADLEDDATLVANIDKEHKRQTTNGDHFPNLWVHTSEYGKKVKEDTEFIVLEEQYSKPRLGLAVCTRKIRVLNARNRPSTVLFYRYRRGWNVRLANRQQSQKIRKKLGLRDVTSLGQVVTQRVRHYLLQRQAHQS